MVPLNLGNIFISKLLSQCFLCVNLKKTRILFSKLKKLDPDPNLDPSGCTRPSFTCIINSLHYDQYLNFSMACLINLSKAPLPKFLKIPFDGVFDQFT